MKTQYVNIKELFLGVKMLNKQRTCIYYIMLFQNNSKASEHSSSPQWIMSQQSFSLLILNMQAHDATNLHSIQHT